MKGRRKINLGAVTVMAAACLLLSSALSWAEVKLIVVRNTATNALTATVCDSTKASPCVAVTIPGQTNFTSHLLPTLGWDQTIGANASGGWTIVGMGFVGTNPNLSAWAGEIVYNSGSTPSATFELVSGAPDVAVPMTGGVSYEQVAYAAPAACMSYSYTCTEPCPQSGSCRAAVTGSFPLSCSGGTPPATTTTCTYVPPQCTSYTYTPGACQFGNTAPVLSSVGSPSGCVGGATPATTVTCTYVPPTCAAADVTLWNTCQPNNTQTASNYASTCAAPTTPLTRTCTYGLPACTAADVTLWGACQSNNTRTASTYASTCTAPSTPLTQTCTYTPPSTSGFTALVFNNGSQSKQDSLGPGESKYYTYTVPTGMTVFSMNVSSISQNGDLNMVITQTAAGVSTESLDRYLRDALAYYNSDIGLWGTPWFKAYPDPVWSKIGSDFSGEGIYVKSSTANPPRNQAGFAASIPGTYYVVVKNDSPTSYVNYYVYVKQ